MTKEVQIEQGLIDKLVELNNCLLSAKTSAITWRWSYRPDCARRVVPDFPSTLLAAAIRVHERLGMKRPQRANAPTVRLWPPIRVLRPAK